MATASVSIPMLAFPLERVWVASTVPPPPQVPPSLNVTLPSGVPATLDTVAVKVSDWPNTADASLEDTEVVVVAAAIVMEYDLAALPPSTSTTPMVKPYGPPAVVGVPVMAQVPVLRESPGGSAPLFTLQV